MGMRVSMRVKLVRLSIWGYRLLVAFLLLVSSVANAQESDQTMPLDKQLALFLEWFPGRYDSALQQRMDEAANMPEAERNYRRHSIFRRVDLPQFGETVFYAEQYRDGDPEKIYRQRIYTFTLALEENAFRLRVHVPRDVERLRGAYRNPALLSDLQPSDTTVWEGCDLFWRWQGDHFRGELKPGECRFVSEAFGQEIVLEEYLLLGPDYIYFADRGLALDGSYLFGMRSDLPNKSLKVRPFECLVGDGVSRWTHDQGGEFSVGGGEIPRRFVLQRFFPDKESLSLIAIQADKPAIVAMAAVDGDDIGVLEDGLAIDCTHRPEAVYRELR